MNPTGCRTAFAALMIALLLPQSMAADENSIYQGKPIWSEQNSAGIDPSRSGDMEPHPSEFTADVILPKPLTGWLTGETGVMRLEARPGSSDDDTPWQEPTGM